MNIHSVFFKLNTLFLLALLTTVLAGWLTVMHILKRDQTDLLLKSRLILREYRHQHRIPEPLIHELGLVRVAPSKVNPLLRTFQRNTRRHRMKPLHVGGAHVFPARNYTYLLLRTKRMKVLLRQRESFWTQLRVPLSIFGGLLGLLLLIYWLLRRALLPIRRLQQDIVRYGEGQYPDAETFSQHQDEIAEVGNAFYASAHQTRRLIQSRQLFVRNIFHELNTPVTKGKILAELVEDSKTQSMLDSIFSRLASLLKELAQMEQITSQDTRLQLGPVRILDLIDQARDLLYLDEPIPVDITKEQMNADFPTMSIAFKNLIDNGRKYGRNLRIVSRKDGIEFISEGTPLAHPLSYYVEPFASGDTHTGEGFGLGLYIVDQIARKHHLTLHYRHENNHNIFSLKKS